MTALALLFGLLSLLTITACERLSPDTRTSDILAENASINEQIVKDIHQSPRRARLLEGVFQGRTRSYWLYAPPMLATGPDSNKATVFTSMIMVLHGTGSSGEQMLFMGDFVKHAHANHYIVVAPNALGRAFNDGSGRAGPATNNEAPLDIDDVAFLAELKQRLGAEYLISPEQNFLVGFSSGGAMTQRVALQQGDAFSAYVSVGGHLWADGGDSVHAKPLLLIFGDSDPLNPIDGGDVNYGGGLILQKPAHLSTARDWSKRFGCTTQVQASQDIVQQTGWYQCDGGDPVLYQQIAGLGHFWAGGNITTYPSLSTERVGPYLGRFITTEVIWDYFKHLKPANDTRRPGLTIIRP